MGRKALIKELVASTGELDAELVGSRSPTLPHSSFDLPRRLLLLVARAPPLAALSSQIDALCPASTIFAGSCCLIEKCYRKIST